MSSTGTHLRNDMSRNTRIV